MFDLPENVVYLDGNSLGPVVSSVHQNLDNRVREEWGKQLINGWNVSGWLAEPARVGNRIAGLIGAAPDTLMVGESLSVQLYQALACALAMQPARRIILSDTGNFPGDLYMAQSLIDRLQPGYRLKLVEPDAIEASLDSSIAVLMLTHVDYRTGRLHNLKNITRQAHDLGIPVVWDLAHSTGALAVDVAEHDVDFAVGCTYKYLNGGPGSPAFIYVAPRLHHGLQPALTGWLGHAKPFDFLQSYQPAAGVECLRIGTPTVLAMAALDAALDVWEGVPIDAVRAESIRLSEYFIAAVESRCPGLKLVSPRNATKRGSQVSFAFEHGYAAMQALIQYHGVIGDFRAPDLMRFAFTPLYLTMDEVEQAATAIEKVMTNREWDDPILAQRATVT